MRAVHQRLSALPPHRTAAIVLPLLLIAASQLEAQLRPVQPKGFIGINATLARPFGEFQRFVNWGGGLDLYGVINVDDRRHLGVRIDGSFLIYGHESFETPLLPFTDRVWVDVNTNNFIFNLGVGPQVTFGGDHIRPYLFATGGLSYFATISSVGGTGDVGDFASSTNFDDVTLALTAGGGLLVQLSHGKRPVSLDLSVQSIYHGEAEYLRRGGIIENRDGSLSFLPIRSQANLVNFRVGVAVGL